MPTLMGNDNSRHDYRRQQQAGHRQTAMVYDAQSVECRLRA